MQSSTEYEIFTQEIYQTLINAQGLNTINVKHNIKIEGKSGQKHQIDVYWEYEIAGVIHKVAIECKNYASTVSIGKVRDFYGVLADIGNISGIIVTKQGFQKGSKEFAEQYGINLKELRIPKDQDWEGRIRTISLNLRMIIPHVKSRQINIDQEWVKTHIKFDNDDDFSYTLDGMADQIWIVDSSGNKLNNFHELDTQLPHEWKGGTGFTHTYNFPDGYIEVAKYGKIKVASIKYEYDVHSGEDNLIIDGSETAKAILKDAISGEIKFFDKDGTIK